jgi:peptidoglycan/LPS O-acetylase OafA/YrhL
MARERTTGTGSSFRPEIQALRALAVTAVVVYHFWPNRLPGGYVGVDVFFVVSGYLITAHLLRELADRGTVRVPAFWARRIRRLLPASLLVLVVVTLGVILVAPSALWSQYLREIVASALYVENWILAQDSVDYLASENAASPVQHYWSLSVEEQFYLVWPLLIVAAVMAARRAGRRNLPVVFGAIALVTALSLVFSVWCTASAPAPAYFVTPTRAWEFGAGALLAFSARSARDIRLPRHLAAAMSWIGVVSLLAACLLYSPETPFPGIAALLPVGGTLVVLAAGLPRAPWSPSWLMRWRPVQFLGDISYSVYLWHWPLLILGPLVIGAPMGNIAKVVAIFACLSLAWATKVFIEDPGRTWPVLAAARPRRTLVAMVVAMALVAAVPLGTIAFQRWSIARQATAIDASVGAPCVGASAFAPSAECADSRLETLLPARAGIYDDTQGAFSCYDSSPDGDIPECSFGSNDPEAIRVAVVGDSHAAMLLPGLRDVAEDENWRVDVFVSRGCVWSQSDIDDVENGCHPRNAAMQELLTSGEPYGLVLLTARRSLDVPSGEPSGIFPAAGPQWDAVAARGTRIVALADNPLVPERLIDCVIEAPDDSSARACTIPEDEAYHFADGLADAAAAHPGVTLIDLRDFFCRDDECPMVIGDVIVYRDRDHVTGTFSRTLAPFLADAIDAVISR